MTAATIAPRNFVLVLEDGAEHHRYTQRGAANRAAKAIPGARVLTVADWDAELAADAALDAAHVPAGFELAHAHATPVPAEDAAEDAMMAAIEEDAPAEELAEIEAERAENDRRAAAAYERLAARRPATEPAAPAEEAPVQEPAEAPAAPADEDAAKAERAAKYKAKTAEGPAVEILRDGVWTEHRRYECDTRAARAARGLATRQRGVQQVTRVVDAAGAVLLDCETDPLVIQARIDGVTLQGIRPI